MQTASVDPADTVVIGANSGAAELPRALSLSNIGCDIAQASWWCSQIATECVLGHSQEEIIKINYCIRNN